jgi:hypothetical protein
LFQLDKEKFVAFGAKALVCLEAQDGARNALELACLLDMKPLDEPEDAFLRAVETRYGV